MTQLVILKYTTSLFMESVVRLYDYIPSLDGLCIQIHAFWCPSKRISENALYFFHNNIYTMLIPATIMCILTLWLYNKPWQKWHQFSFVFNLLKYSCHRNSEMFCHLYYTLLEKLHEMNVARSRIGQQRVRFIRLRTKIH